MASWLSALSKTRQALSGAFSKMFGKNQPLDGVTLEELEETLIGADIAAPLVMEWLDTLGDARRGEAMSRKEQLRVMLLEALGEPRTFVWPEEPNPFAVLVVGINGSGKTTTCAKLAHGAKQQGKKPLLGAADTFRAAGTDQLRIWADRVGCEVVSGTQGADAAAVAYDALDAAAARDCNVVVVDTAGRMHTKAPLMNELAKVERAMRKRFEHAPSEIWMVLDAALGQNAIHQARQFHQVVPLTGVIVSKLDGSAKAGFIFSIARELRVPVLFAGLGEGMDDLTPFDPEAFVGALLGEDEREAEAAESR
jgi:fused signal recognition particle receptor